MPLTHFHAATDVGLQRSNNEDSYLSMPFLGAWVVADGMGGHAAGEVASAIVCETIQEQLSKGVCLSDAIQLSHKAVLEAANRGVGGSGMGSTVVALHSRGSEYDIGWVGDSRAYSYYPSRPKSLRQLTRDHSYVQYLVDSGVITPEEMHNHPEKNIITQCLGSTDLEQVDVGLVTAKWHNPQWVILCSDGLTDAVTDTEITSILNKTTSVNDTTETLIRAALNNGGRDNITVQVISNPGGLARLVHSTTSTLSKIIP
ncbi:PP2C family protein-serine/threonine phosphatase [Teredinibacter haidensis]|uniref:PP2C family protein-serine/threonine phosphatase n=1 Tax=Teredinibacter haidensis TaxID=2731755 RepID=UPI000948A311|nr:protein phosphatase 2C domain-containing protein [Teredinibacter haidensis]